jgi:hypothetical protein
MNQFYYLRNQKVILDKELTELYKVTTGASETESGFLILCAHLGSNISLLSTDNQLITRSSSFEGVTWVTRPIDYLKIKN